MRRATSCVIGVVLLGAGLAITEGTASALVICAEPVELTTDAAIPTIDARPGVDDDAGISYDLSGDANWAVFKSRTDPVGGNADGSSEIFLLDIAGDDLFQLTNSSGAEGTDGNSWGMRGPVINQDGSRVAFATTRSVTDEVGANNYDLFLADVSDPEDVSFEQLTTTVFPDEAYGPSISNDGTLVAFVSDADLTGDNADGNRELFLADATQDPAALTQITDTVGPAMISTPQLSGDGSTVVFSSGREDLVPGQNDSGQVQVFAYDVAGQTVSQLTPEDGGGQSPSVDATGSTVVFASTFDYTGANPVERLLVYRMSLPSGQITQLYRTTTGTDPISALVGAWTALSDDGTRAFWNRTTNSDNAGTFYRDTPGIEHEAVDVFGLSRITQLDDPGNTFLVLDTASSNAYGDLLLVTCPARVPGPFTDVADTNPFLDQIGWLTTDTGVASGFPDDTFHPTEAVKRQQIARFLYRLAGQPTFIPPLHPTFPDVPGSSPFYKEVEWAASEEIIVGFPDGTFHPRDAVTRQQLARFAYVMADAPTFAPPSTPTFSDVATSSAFYSSVEWVASEGIATGFPGGTFHPKDPVKRQAAANMLFNLAVNYPEYPGPVL